MTIGISKEYLESIINEEKYGGLLSKLISKCTELDPWLPIDENTPKDRELWLYWKSTRHMERAFYNHMCGQDAYPTHYQELPDDPEPGDEDARNT